MAEAVVELSGVSFAYNHIPVLQHVEMRVERGQFFSITGPNGGGKTTLLRIILGLLRPTAGEVRVLGGSPESARRRIGYVPQNPQHDSHFPVTVGEVVAMGRLTWRVGSYSPRDRRAAEESLAEVGMAGLADRAFSELSGGQRQRVLIARALAGAPEILILDEPTSHVDVSVGKKLSALLKELNRRMTIIMVTHDMGFVYDMISNVACVNRSVVVQPARSLDGASIQELYGEPMRQIQHDHYCTDPESEDD